MGLTCDLGMRKAFRETVMNLHEYNNLFLTALLWTHYQVATHIPAHLSLFNNRREDFGYTHFIGEKAEALGGEVIICPRSHSWEVSAIRPQFIGYRARALPSLEEFLVTLHRLSPLRQGSLLLLCFRKRRDFCLTLHSDIILYKSASCSP